jgi:hypothetical protein
MKLIDPADPSGGAGAGGACGCVCSCACFCESEEDDVEDTLIVSHESGDTISNWVGNWIPIIT